MQEGAIMEFIKWILYLFMIVMLMTLSLYYIQVSDSNTFKQQVNYEIERNGGLTDVAVNNLGDYSKEMYGGRYRVESDQLYEQVEFGEIVEYTVVGEFVIAFFELPTSILEFDGQGVSLIRK